jgi:hypothetical protein
MVLPESIYRLVVTTLLVTCCIWLAFRPTAETTAILAGKNTEKDAPIHLLQRTMEEVHQQTSLRRLESDADKNNISVAKNLIGKLLSLIYRRYELDTRPGGQFFRTSNNVDPRTWDILKYKFATKMLEGNGEFLMTFGGSSVTAGHDNFYNQSYPAIFNKRMKDVFAALGIKLIVRNIALGANNCVPYIFCYESMGGMNPDFVNWEQVNC